MVDPIKALAEALKNGHPPALAWVVEHGNHEVDPVAHAWGLSEDGEAMLDILMLVDRGTEIPLEIRIKPVGSFLAGEIMRELGRPNIARSILIIDGKKEESIEDYTAFNEKHDGKMEQIRAKTAKEMADDIHKLGIKPPTLTELLETLKNAVPLVPSTPRSHANCDGGKQCCTQAGDSMDFMPHPCPCKCSCHVD